MSPSRVLEEHSSRELTEWQAYDRVYGLDLEADARAGVIAASVWNAAGGIPEGGNRRRPAVPSDFFGNLDLDQEDGESRTHRRTHDQSDDDGQGSSVEVESVELDDELEPEPEGDRFESFKSQLVMWALKHNAAERAAKKLERDDLGDPPPDPEVN